MNKVRILVALLGFTGILQAQDQGDTLRPNRTEIIRPIHKASFTNNGEWPERKKGGNPRMENGYLSYDCSLDCNRQVDPQIADGGGYVLHGTNNCLVI